MSIKKNLTSVTVAALMVFGAGSAMAQQSRPGSTPMSMPAGSPKIVAACRPVDGHHGITNNFVVAILQRSDGKGIFAWDYSAFGDNKQANNWNHQSPPLDLSKQTQYVAPDMGTGTTFTITPTGNPRTLSVVATTLGGKNHAPRDFLCSGLG